MAEEKISKLEDMSIKTFKNEVQSKNKWEWKEKQTEYTRTVWKFQNM